MWRGWSGATWAEGQRDKKNRRSPRLPISDLEATAFSKRRKTRQAGSFKLADLNYSGDKVRGQPGFV
jgi:hypothetical protein